MTLMSLEAAQAQLPRVGDIRMEMPTIDQTGTLFQARELQKCVVVAVHPGHLWYTVRFLNSGFLESYKVPKTKEGVVLVRKR